MGQQQTPTGKKRIFMLDGSVQDEFGNVIQAAPPGGVPGILKPPAGATAPGSDNGPGMTPKDAVIGALKAATFGAGFIPGGGLLGTSLRMAVPALLGAGEAAVEGNDPIDAAAAQGALGAVGEGAGMLPKAFNRAAFASAGLFRGKGNLGKRATDALTELNAERPVWKPVLAGQTKTVERLKKAAGQGVEAAELATPGQVTLPQLGGASQDLFDASMNTRAPITLDKFIRADNREFIQQQAMKRNGITQAVWDTLKPKQKMAIIASTELTARDLGELERGLGKGNNAVTAARREGQFVPESASQQAQVDADKIKRANDLKMDLADSSGDPGKLRAANKRFGNTATLDEAHNRMRFTGSLADWSVIGARMGIGAGLGQLTGLGYGPGAVLGLGLLNPPALSATGHILEAGARTLPHAYRAADTIDSMSEDERKKRAKRRNPGE